MKDGFSRKPSVTFTEEEKAFARRIVNGELTEEEERQLDAEIEKACIFEETPREEWIKEATKAKSSIDIF
jgi:hypothetical protein